MNSKGLHLFEIRNPEIITRKVSRVQTHLTLKALLGSVA